MTEYLLSVMFLCFSFQISDQQNEIEPPPSKWEDADLDTYYAEIVKTTKNPFHSSYPGIAIAANWMGLKETSLGQTPNRNDRKFSFNPFQIGRFVGILEAKAGVTAPKWWAKELANSTMDIRGNVFSTSKKKEELLEFEVSAGQFIHDKSCSVHEEEQGIRIKFNNTDYLLAKDESQRLRTYMDIKNFAVVEVSSNRLCVVPYPDTSGFCEIFCLDNKNSKPVWKSEIWAPPPVGHALTNRNHFLSLKISGDKLFAFGRGYGHFYLEVFDVESGKALFRFSTSYSFLKQP